MTSVDVSHSCRWQGQIVCMRAFGDTGVLLQFANPAKNDAERARELLEMAYQVECRADVSWQDVSLGYDEVLVIYNPVQTSLGTVCRGLCQALAEEKGRPTPRRALWDIPVRYGGVDGPDLEEVARCLEMDVDEVVRRHTEPTYLVRFLGFIGGFPYLDGLPASLAVPRRATPRVAVPAGSVGIGGEQTGIYPHATPGGWQLIGRTDWQLFDANRIPPALLSAGDLVRFHAVERGTSVAVHPPKRRSVTQPASGECDADADVGDGI
ncbi:MAG: 5-oxoprolinase subunit PxpB [Alicyclobacillaceae bacterium]|uniref:5-oxoprolinase subunit PxpB n=1 Tax=Alicyclobacillus sp. SP_1 TaxID=2942475 RepID=UPI0021578C3F|nr:5-oxoprolinase subunit PxpB [Alicyclobacillus sp. SP_1]MCY0887134.1 5-oxoprolinase subunit PxpB [Alicyclobacillaceae bacterium]